MKFEIDRRYIDEGLVTEREHPSEPYLIYNYTPKCQFSKAWDDVTMQCRGLIVHRDTREVIARPFKKFFNYEEHIEKGLPIPNERPIVYDKRDGSLGILYWSEDGNTPYIATRGSFTSDQALWATEWFRANTKMQVKSGNETYLFEIIYPENRIVVDYGRYKGLDLLAILDTETGKTLPMVELDDVGTPVCPIDFTSFAELKSVGDKNKEGFTLHFPESELRLKIKLEDYVRLHKIMTGLSEIGVWEMLRDGKDPYAQDIPDEMYDWLKDVVELLQAKFRLIETNARKAVDCALDQRERRDQAEIIKKMTPYTGVAFSMLDGKDYSQAIWRMIRPHGSSTFRNDIDS